jgi:hypothetical protein
MKLTVYMFAICATTLIYFSSCKKDQTPKGFISTDCPDTIKFSTQILPMISENCFSCHNNGTSPTLSNHTNISSNAAKMLKSMKGELQLMPQGGPAINDSLIKQFECWINQGKLNN